ncbi:MAG: MFS transporter [Chloroflexota bacterium]
MKLPRIFFGWYIVAAGSVASALLAATRSYGAGLFLVPLISEFGWSRAEVSGAFSLGRLEGGILGPAGGILVDRLGPRVMMLVGVPITALGFFLLASLSHITDWAGMAPLIVFYVIWVAFIALGDSVGASDAVSASVANWFHKKRALALGMLSIGVPVGGAIWTPALGWVIDSSGWRSAAVIMGLAFLFVGIPTAMVMRHRPEPYGWLPDGDPLPPSAPGSAGQPGGERRATTLIERPGFTLRQALATPAFWLLNGSVALRIMVTSSVIIHIAALMQDLGMSTTEAAGMLSALALVSIFGRVAMGWLGDRFGIRSVYMGSLVTLIAGLIVVAYAHETWQIWLFMILFAPAYGGLASMTPAFRADLFGVKAYASIGGAMEPVIMLGTITGPFMAGYIFDMTGSYRTAMLIFAAASAVNLILIGALKRPPLPATVASAPATTS